MSNRSKRFPSNHSTHRRKVCSMAGSDSSHLHRNLAPMPIAAARPSPSSPCTWFELRLRWQRVRSSRRAISHLWKVTWLRWSKSDKPLGLRWPLLSFWWRARCFWWFEGLLLGRFGSLAFPGIRKCFRRWFKGFAFPLLLHQFQDIIALPLAS